MSSDPFPIPEAASFVSHLECSLTGERHDAGVRHNLSRAGKPLLVRYDLAGAKRALPREALRDRPQTLWRYRELLPVRETRHIVSLGEPVTPIVAAPRLARRLGGKDLWIKQEGLLPTGSFKARGQTVAISMAKELGITAAVVPTAGNAGAAMAAYCSRAGIDAWVFCPEDTPEAIVRQAGLQGAHVFLVNGFLDDCAKIAGQGARERGWFDLSTLKEPYRIEGKKTMGYELAEQMGWDVPDVVLYPTGGGTGFIGMWKAFDEMEALGWIGPKRPRMVCVQSTGCGPVVKAWQEGKSHAERWNDVRTFASGFKAPVAIGDFMLTRIIRESGGFGILVSDDEIRDAWADMGRTEGILLCPEGAGCLAAYGKALADGRIGPDERVLLFDTASGLKSDLPPAGTPLDRTQPIDLGRLA